MNIRNVVQKLNRPLTPKEERLIEIGDPVYRPTYKQSNQCTNRICLFCGKHFYYNIKKDSNTFKDLEEHVKLEHINREKNIERLTNEINELESILNSIYTKESN